MDHETGGGSNGSEVAATAHGGFMSDAGDWEGRSFR